MRMSSGALRFTCLSAGMAAALIPTLPPPAVPRAEAQIFGISDEQEVQIGRQVEAEVAKKPGFVDDPAKTARVTAIGLRLAHVSERPNLPWTYHVVRDSTANAFAAPGGFVFVDQGLLDFVTSEDELAFVLAHETTHVAHRHAVDLAGRDMELQFGAVVLTQILFGGGLGAYELTQLARGLIDAKYSRDKEFEADRYGVIYGRKAGFNPTASLSFFERLQQQEKSQPALARAFEDHPETPARINALRSQLRQLGYDVAPPVGAPAPVSAPRPAAVPPPSPPGAVPADPSYSGVGNR